VNRLKNLLILAVVVLLLLVTTTGCNPSLLSELSPSPSTIPSTEHTPAVEELKVHFIDVGQGDSILIDLGETEVLIDGGDKSPGVVGYLRNFVDGDIEVMVATHPHADHIGGLIGVLNAFQVEQVWYNGETSETKTYTDFMAAVNSEGAEVHIGKRGDRITAGTLTFLILNPKNTGGTTNNNSIVLSLSYGTVDFLFMGDAEKEAEGAMLVASDMPVPDIDILKVGHHGSRTASSPDFLALTTQEVAVYMAGTGNSYGHPHQETLDALARIGARIYGTDVVGTIMITTDGQTHSVSTED
jgi:competence protein ComEC